MVKQNMYWSVYKNLEKEVLKLADFLHFSDDQLNVYSIHIADLIIRCSIEIESISKDLYSMLGGNMSPLDDEGQVRDIYFDTDCLSLLNEKWILSKKQIFISSINFYFEEEKNKILMPLHKSHKRGTRGSQWKQAYQAVKHDRKNSLKKATIGNLLNALGALYVLNIYYRDESINIGKASLMNSFDATLGSDVFSVLVANAHNISISDTISDKNIDSKVQNILENAIYIKRYTEDSLKKLHKEIVVWNRKTIDNLLKSPKITEFLRNNPNYKITSTSQLAFDVGGEALLKEIIPATNIGYSFANSCFEAVLNKGESIYPTLTEAIVE